MKISAALLKTSKPYVKTVEKDMKVVPGFTKFAALHCHSTAKLPTPQNDTIILARRFDPKVPLRFEAPCKLKVIRIRTES